MSPELVSFYTTTFYNVVFAFFWGACWGSFMNVVIYRFPLGRSVVHPPSACPSCKTHIKAYDNIPVFSWLILRGKCRACKAPFSPMYCINEALFGLTSALAVWTHPGQPLAGFFLSTALLAGGPLIQLLVKHRKAPWYLWFLTLAALSGYVYVR